MREITLSQAGEVAGQAELSNTLIYNDHESDYNSEGKNCQKVWAFSVKAISLNVRPSATLEESLLRLAGKNLTSVQSKILDYIYSREAGDAHTYSWYVKSIAAEMGVPESTTKWCLNNLRGMLLIEAGSSLQKGIPLRLTYPGLVVAKGLSKSQVGCSKEDFR